MTITSYRFRADGEVVVLQVEEEKQSGYSYKDVPTRSWRDAKVEDLMDVAALIHRHESEDWRVPA